MASITQQAAKGGSSLSSFSSTDSLLSRWNMLEEKLRNDGTKLGVEQADQIAASLGVLDEAWERFSQSEISFAFNGGKDSTVLLYLLLVFLEKRTGSEAEARKVLSELRLCYFEGKDEFPEVIAFLEEAKAKYNLNITKLPSDYKVGLGMLEADGIKSVLMGQRSTDPAGKGLEHFSPCTPGWPKIVRVNPILYWTYSTVWAWLRGLEVSYCKLYNEGYTSLGSVASTTKNPHLGDKPAYELDNGDANERISRANTPTNAP